MTLYVYDVVSSEFRAGHCVSLHSAYLLHALCGACCVVYLLGKVPMCKEYSLDVCICHAIIVYYTLSYCTKGHDVCPLANGALRQGFGQLGGWNVCLDRILWLQLTGHLVMYRHSYFGFCMLQPYCHYLVCDKSGKIYSFSHCHCPLVCSGL